MARYSLTAGSNISASSSFATATISPSAGRLVLAFVLSQKLGGPGTPTASGNSFTWQQVASVTNAGAGNSRITCFRAMGPAPSVGPLTFDFAGVQQRPVPGRSSSMTVSMGAVATARAPWCSN